MVVVLQPVLARGKELATGPQPGSAQGKGLAVGPEWDLGKVSVPVRGSAVGPEPVRGKVSEIWGTPASTRIVSVSAEGWGPLELRMRDALGVKGLPFRTDHRTLVTAWRAVARTGNSIVETCRVIARTGRISIAKTGRITPISITGSMAIGTTAAAAAGGIRVRGGTTCGITIQWLPLLG